MAIPPTLFLRRFMKASVEREIKLSVERHFRLPPLDGKPLPSRRLTSTYFDSQDFRLAYGGLTLRRRLEQGKGCWQLKLPAAEERREMEIQGGPGSPPPQVLQDLLVAHLRGEPLGAVATLRTWRRGLRVKAGEGNLADVVLDAVSVLQDR